MIILFMIYYVSWSKFLFIYLGQAYESIQAEASVGNLVSLF